MLYLPVGWFVSSLSSQPGRSALSFRTLACWSCPSLPRFVLSYSGLLVVSQPAPLCPFQLWPAGRVPTCPALSFPTLACWSCPKLPRSVLSYSGLLVVSQPAPLCPFLLWPVVRVPTCLALSFPTLASWSCPTLPRSVPSYSGLLVVSHSALASTCSSSLCGRRDVKNLRTANNYLFWLPALPDATW